MGICRGRGGGCRSESRGRRQRDAQSPVPDQRQVRAAQAGPQPYGTNARIPSRRLPRDRLRRGSLPVRLPRFIPNSPAGRRAPRPFTTDWSAGPCSTGSSVSKPEAPNRDDGTASSASGSSRAGRDRDTDKGHRPGTGWDGGAVQAFLSPQNGTDEHYDILCAHSILSLLFQKTNSRKPLTRLRLCEEKSASLRSARQNLPLPITPDPVSNHPLLVALPRRPRRDRTRLASASPGGRRRRRAPHSRSTVTGGTWRCWRRS
jgi:hypothetical protein